MRNLLTLLILFICNLTLFAQTEISYLDYNYKDCKKSDAIYSLEITKDNDSVWKHVKIINTGETIVIYKLHKANEDIVYSYNYDGTSYLTNEGLFINKRKEGEWLYYNSERKITKKVLYEKDEIKLEKYYDSGIISIEIPYNKGRYNGESKVYYKGVLIKKVTFENGFMIKKEDLRAADSLINNDTVPKLYVEIMPSFVGGESAMMSYIGNNVNYPKKAIENAIEGTVRVKFTVDAKGYIKDIKIITKVKLGYNCEEEAIRVIRQMPRWNAGLQNGTPVPVYFNIPIRFQLF